MQATAANRRIPSASERRLYALERALERAGLDPRPHGRTSLRARRALEAAATRAGAREAIRLLLADWTLAALKAGRAPVELSALLRAAARHVAGDPDTLLFTSCSRAVTSPDVRALTPRIAIDLQLRTLHTFAELDGTSLWLREPDGTLSCVAASGSGLRGHAAHDAAEAILADGNVEDAFAAAVVNRFGKPAGAVVAAGPATKRVAAFVEETASALSFFVERDLLLERNAQRERTLTAALEERLLKHAFDLHDGPLQDLAALGADLALARKQIVPLVPRKQAEAIEGRLDDLGARLHALDDALRATLRPLTAPSVDQLGDTIRREVSSLGVGTHIKASVEVRGDVERLGAEQRRAVVRVVQEALSNVLHHSRAHSVRVRLDGRDSSGVAVTVEDDGRGFDLRRALASVAERGRFGLVGMRERVRLVGGDLQIETAPGAGTRISMVVPPGRSLLKGRR